jgi:hypothetical protein
VTLGVHERLGDGDWREIGIPRRRDQPGNHTRWRLLPDWEALRNLQHASELVIDVAEQT